MIVRSSDQSSILDSADFDIQPGIVILLSEVRRHSCRDSAFEILQWFSAVQRFWKSGICVLERVREWQQYVATFPGRKPETKVHLRE